MGKDSHGKEIYLGLATVRVSGRQRPKASNRTSLAPQPPPFSSSQLSGKENLGPVTTRPDGESGKATVNDYGTSTAGDGTSGASDTDAQFGLVTSTSSSIVASSARPVQAKLPPSTNARKKRSSKRPGGGSKNTEEGEYFSENIYILAFRRRVRVRSDLIRPKAVGVLRSEY